MPQIAYTHSVREFIRELLKRFIPGKWIDRVISERDATFDAKLDAAFSSLDENTATKKDYCASVVSVLCEEVSGICEVTRLVCINRGHRIYADKFLTTEKFVRLVLRQDLEKLERLNAAIADRSKPLCILLHDIGIVLEDKSSGGDAAFSAAEIKKANAELKAIAADVKKTMQTGFKEVNDNIKSGVAAVGEKVDALAAKLKRGKRRGKYDDETIAFCAGVMATADNNATIKNGLNTRVTHSAVFAYNRCELEARGVTELAEFTRIIRAHQAREQRVRDKKSSAVKPNSQRGKYGIMSDMKYRAKSTLALTLAIAGAMASPLRSESADIPHGSGVIYAQPSAKSDVAFSEVCGRVMRVADGDTITILDAPEKGQAFGNVSKQHLSSLVFGNDVRVKYKSRDKYGRILGTVYVDGKDINLEMLRAGLAWHYKRYDKTQAYAAAELEARQSRRGLWVDSNPTPPEQFRHGGKSAAPSSSTAANTVASSRVEYNAGSAMPVGSRTAAPVCDKWPDTGYWLSTNSNKRHNRKCRNTTASKNIIHDREQTAGSSFMNGH